jgi:hypothetical protein
VSRVSVAEITFITIVIFVGIVPHRKFIVLRYTPVCYYYMEAEYFERQPSCDYEELVMHARRKLRHQTNPSELFRERRKFKR